jgi:hypothetical protein
MDGGTSLDRCSSPTAEASLSTDQNDAVAALQPPGRCGAEFVPMFDS